jgi:hypothetical protein
MKEIDPAATPEVNGGLTQRQFEELPYSDPNPASEPRNPIDYNPLPQPQ